MFIFTMFAVFPNNSDKKPMGVKSKSYLDAFKHLNGETIRLNPFLMPITPDEDPP